MNGHRFRRLGAVAVLALMLPFGVPASPLAAAEVPDQVLVWNQHTYNELIGVKAQAPPVALLHFAMVHGAIYDAVNAIDGGYQPYLGAPDAQPSYSKDAAAAAAAYQVLLDLVPDRASQLGAYYEASISAISEEEGASDVAGGVEVGNAAAATMLPARDDDGRFGAPLFPEGTDPGEWRRVPPVTGGNNFKWVGDVKPFLILSAAQFATNGPQELTSAKYAAEFDQVMALGRATGSSRTPDQTQQALFWADHTAAMWTRIARQLSTSQDLSTTENARYFAMLYLTSSDAVIACFQDKERWGFWRPQTAIREAATDGNPSTLADPTWTSFIGNPPYPDHPSGANCFASSFAQTLQDFFGTNQMSFSATHATLGITRHYARFSQAIGEVRLARVYAGIHFMTADAQAVSLGRQVANWRQEHYFQPAA